MQITVIISICALVVSLAMMIINLVNAVKNWSKANKNDDAAREQRVKEETEQQVGIMLALDNIKNMLAEIKQKINTVEKDTKDNHDEIIRMSESIKSEHKRLDNHEQRLNKIEETLRGAIWQERKD